MWWFKMARERKRKKEWELRELREGEKSKKWDAIANLACASQYKRKCMWSQSPFTLVTPFDDLKAMSERTSNTRSKIKTASVNLNNVTFSSHRLIFWSNSKSPSKHLSGQTENNLAIPVTQGRAPKKPVAGFDTAQTVLFSENFIKHKL